MCRFFLSERCSKKIKFVPWPLARRSSVMCKRVPASPSAATRLMLSVTSTASSLFCIRLRISPTFLPSTAVKMLLDRTPGPGQNATHVPLDQRTRITTQAEVPGTESEPRTPVPSLCGVPERCCFFLGRRPSLAETRRDQSFPCPLSPPVFAGINVRLRETAVIFCVARLHMSPSTSFSLFVYGMLLVNRFGCLRSYCNGGDTTCKKRRVVLRMPST